MLKNNFVKNDYLLDYDFINKYNLLNLYDIPKISGVTLEFPLTGLIFSFDEKLTENDDILQIKAFLFLYFFSNNVPFINSNKMKLKKQLDSKTKALFFSLKVVFFNRNDIYNFLILLFIENWSLMLMHEINVFRYKKIDGITLNQFKSVLTFKVPLSTFLDHSSLNILNGINSKDFFITVNFQFVHKFRIINTTAFIKNNNLFWING